VLLIRDGHRIAAAAGYLLFAVAPFWFTPHAAGPNEYGFHRLTTLVANCFLIAGLAFLGYMALTQLRGPRHGDLAGSQRDGGGNLEDPAGEVRGVRGEQEGDQVGDLRGAAEPAQRDRFGQVGPGRLRY